MKHIQSKLAWQPLIRRTGSQFIFDIISWSPRNVPWAHVVLKSDWAFRRKRRSSLRMEGPVYEWVASSEKTLHKEIRDWSLRIHNRTRILSPVSWDAVYTHNNASLSLSLSTPETICECCCCSIKEILESYDDISSISASHEYYSNWYNSKTFIRQRIVVFIKDSLLRRHHFNFRSDFVC